MTDWTPKDAPVGQVPSGIFQVQARRKKRGRPKRRAAPQDSQAESGTPSQASDTTESPGSVQTSSPVSSVNESQPDNSGSSPVPSTPDNDGQSTNPAPVSAFTRMRDKTRYSTPSKMPSKREAEKFDDFAKRFHASPDIRLVGDVSVYNPPPEGPKNLQGPPHPPWIPGIEVRKEPMRPHRRQMSDEDGYYDQVTPVDTLPRFFDALPHDYTVDQHAISSRASLEWIDSPGLNPSDVRARRLKITVPVEDIKNKPDEIIWRVTYSCNGLCRALPNKETANPPALATKDSFATGLLGWAKGRNKEHDRLALRRLSPRASQLRLQRIANEISEKENSSSDKETSSLDSNAAQHETDTPTEHEDHQCGDDCPHECKRTSNPVLAGPTGQDERTDDEADALDDGSTLDSGSDNDRSAENQNNKKRENECACGSYLMITMTNTQSQFGQCTIRMRRESHHPRPRSGVKLKMSPHIRHILHEMAGCFSMTKSKLKLWFKTTIEPNDQHVIWLKSCRNQKDKAYMGQRLPGKGGWASAMKTAANSYRISSSPLAAIEIIAARSPESLIAHRGPHFLGASKDNANCPAPDVAQKGSDGKERMECVIAPPLARLSAILQVFRMGMMMDSSWRNKNAWGAPVSVLCTLNEQHHMIPLAMMVSAHADHIAYEYLLREFERACRETALQVVAGTFRPEIDGVPEADLVRQCRIFLKEGLQPRFMMIDRSHAERIAIQNVLACPIRVCQFHMMQAIGRRLKRIYGRRNDRDLLTSQALDDIRSCQRCDERDHWDECYQRLEGSIRSRTPEDPDAWPIFDKYLRDEWFNDIWGPTVLDYALHPAVTRDGPWSTNNYSEACFRTFDRVFLSCRANHRIDRLILVLIDAFFPFYEDFKGGLPRPDPNLQTQLFGGLNRWELGCIHPCPIDSVLPPHRDRFGESVFCVLPPKRQAIASSTQFCGETSRGKEVCTCTYWSGTGKRCVHLWAKVAYDQLGSVFDFDENVAIIESHLRMRGIGEPPPPPPLIGKKRGRPNAKKASPDDNKLEEDEFKQFWGEDLTGAEQSLADSHPRMFETSYPAADPVTPPPVIAPRPRLAESDTSDSDGDASPIGRRFATPATESVGAGPTEVGPESGVSSDPSSWSHSKPGAPPNIQPLQPNRVTRRREPIKVVDSPDIFAPSGGSSQDPTTAVIPRGAGSTLQLSRKARKQVARMKPIGIKNTGNDCYILSLLQVMARVHTWDKALTHEYVREKLSDCVEYQVWIKVRDSLDGKEPHAFPDLRSTLFDAGLIMSPTSMGDPFDLFDRLLPHFDDKGCMVALRYLPHVKRFTSFLCAHHDHKHENQPVSSVLVYPLRDGAPREDTLSAMLNDSIKADAIKMDCDCAEVLGTFKNDILSPVLTLHVVWGLRAPHTGADTVRIGRPFDIPPVLPFGDDFHHWNLKGVIVRYGSSTSAGHYVAIVSHNERFWRIDDDVVTIVGNVGQEAFKNAGYPVMIVYEEAGAVDFVPPTELDPWGDWAGPFDDVPAYDPAGTVPAEQIDPNPPCSLPSSSAVGAATYTNAAATDPSHGASASLAPIPQVIVDQPRAQPGLQDQRPAQLEQALQSDGVPGPTNPEPFAQVLDTQVAGSDVQRGRSASVQWVRDLPGWNVSSWALPKPPHVSAQVRYGSVDALLPQTYLGFESNDPSTPTPQAARASQGSPPTSLRVKAQQSAPLAIDRTLSTAAPIEPDKTDRAPVTIKTVSVTDVMKRFDQLSIWRSPQSQARQTRILWCTPESRTETTSAQVTPRPQALRDLHSSLKSVQVGLDDPMTDMFSHGLISGNQNTQVTCEDFSRFINPKEWFSNTLCDAACATALCRLERLERERGIQPMASSSPIVKYAVQLLPWVSRQDGTASPRFAEKGVDGKYTSLPWPALGRDKSWRDRNTIGVINVSYRNHFICLAIFGPGRLVIPFDGYGGRADNGILRMRWSSLLNDRLEYELEKGWVGAADNEGWIFAFNSDELRAALRWPTQNDAHTCGPLAVAAAVLISQGLQPNWDNLGINRTPMFVETWPIWLRDCILIMIMEECSHWAKANGRPNGRLAEGLSCWKWIEEIKQELGIV